MQFLFNTLNKISSSYGIKIQLDPTFQPHLNLYAGIVFQLICETDNSKCVIAKGGRYDELVRFFNPKEKIINGLGFTISIDNLRNLIKNSLPNQSRILLLFKDTYLLDKAIQEQKKLQKKGIITILELNPCKDTTKANKIMNDNNCTEIRWVK